MIIGIGIDLVEFVRLADIRITRLSERILTSREMETIPTETKRRLEWVAGRFAAKEAVAKAAGCGIGGQLSFQDITIIKGEKGCPSVELSTKSIAALGYQEDVHIHLSITHTNKTAAAFVVIEQRGGIK
ncbi:holo-[acyl-carrier-protein] synthase [Marininema mesophilum]|uniref:Holo-[acyl-carrier-protein] synthase n=1 Tax=Marininema mesophilum TaxID=1048340 RepID=A0A1H3AUG7_9BACL|nr:holo-ACP synthase [Marininema mesophilum]SDX33362.1 holo-[acyl-carrier-protein] synthase [Marininema mesophilum]